MQRSDRIKTISTATLCIAMTLITIGFVESLIRRDAEHERGLIHDMLLNTGALIGQEIQRNLSHGIVVTDTLHVLLHSNGYDATDFDEWGKQLLAISTGASAVQLAPNGVISYVYPMKEHAGALGHDVLRDKRRDDGAMLAIKNRGITFIGPLKLIQNNKFAVIARKPVFKTVNGQETFWGFTVALLHVEDILPERMRQLESQGLYIKLIGENPDSKNKPVLFASNKWVEENDVTMRIEVPNGTWTLRLGHDPIDNKYYMLSRIIAIFLSCTFSIFIFIQQCMMSKKQKKISFLNERLTELSLKDDLTGVGNRRAGIQTLEQQIQLSNQTDERLSIIMLDLDLFKQVNDHYGHPAGDQLLKHSALFLEASIRKSDSVFRIGGDEFLVHFPHTKLDECRRVADKIMKMVERMPCTYEGTELPVSFSVGLAEYQPNESLDSLLQRVDVKLYEAKKAGRNTIRY